MSYYFWSLILIPIQLSSSLFPKVYLESLLSHIHFKGYDVMASIKPDTEGTKKLNYLTYEPKPFFRGK